MRDIEFNVTVTKFPGEEVTIVMVMVKWSSSWGGKQGHLFCRDSGTRVIFVTALFCLEGGLYHIDLQLYGVSSIGVTCTLDGFMMILWMNINHIHASKCYKRSQSSCLVIYLRRPTCFTMYGQICIFPCLKAPHPAKPTYLSQRMKVCVNQWHGE